MTKKKPAKKPDAKLKVKTQKVRDLQSKDLEHTVGGRIEPPPICASSHAGC